MDRATLTPPRWATPVGLPSSRENGPISNRDQHHVGDSRAYLLRKGRLEQLTRDHTHVQNLVELGLLKPEQARTHRLRHHLTNALGGMPGVKGEILKFRLADGDRLLLCSDGLTEPIRDDRIAEMLGQFPNPGRRLPCSD